MKIKKMNYYCLLTKFNDSNLCNNYYFYYLRMLNIFIHRTNNPLINFNPMIQKRLVFALSGILALLALASCNSEFSGYKKTKEGIYYKIFSENDTITPKIGDVVTMGMIYKAGDSLLFNSYTEERPFQIILQEPQYQGDVFACIAMMSLGDSAVFKIKADSFFYITARTPMLPPFVDSTSYMTFNIKLNKVQTQEEAKLEREAELVALQGKEAGIIEQYVKENNITVPADEEGLYFIETKKGSGKKVSEGLIIVINYTLKFTNGDILFSTLTTGETIDFEYGTQFDTKGFNKGIGQMRKGGKATLIVPSSLAFGATGAAGGRVEPYTPLIYEIEVVDIRDKAEFEKEKAAKAEAKNAALAQEEQSAIVKYLSDNEIDVSPTESGLYYIETMTGDGEMPISGDKVKVHYTLTTLTNDTIDSSLKRNQPLEFTIDQPGIIKGWHEAIKYMRVGGKAIWLIPSKLGYGPAGRPPMIQPFTPLLFDVEFIEIVK